MSAAQTASGGLTWRLAGTPPHILRCDGWSQRREATPWRERIATKLEEADAPEAPGRFTARITISFPDRRRRECHNFETIISRALWEALTETGWIADRDDVGIDVRLRRGARKPATTIRLEARP